MTSRLTLDLGDSDNEINGQEHRNSNIRDENSINDETWATIQVLQENPLYSGQEDNEVRTTRYRWYNFIPLTLYEQYRVLTNVYFLIVLVVCFFPWTPVNYLFQLCPMIVVLVISMVKSLVEDLLKKRQDRLRNNAPIDVLRNGEFRQIRSCDLKVGDVIRISEDIMVPADILFISSEHEHGHAYFSEANLNGETAVKVIEPHVAFKDGALRCLGTSQYTIDVPKPDRDLTRFDARLRSGSNVWPISINNILLRGVCTHYTEGIIGIVLRTGHDTKIMQNARHPPAKLTQFDHNLNRILVQVFCFKMILTLVCTFLGVANDRGEKFKAISQLYPGYGTSFAEYFVQYFILYSYIFPISLTVTLEFIRLFHSVVMANDPDMADKEFGYASCHNSNVIGQIGLVTHILSDKTGTLTENIMVLKKFASNGLKHDAESFIANLNNNKVKDNLEFLLALAICNSVTVHHKRDGADEYNSESPDEQAFVEFAEKCGIKLTSRTFETVSVNVSGTDHEYQILASLPFHSDRKRQSVIIRDEEGRNILYCKGADNVIAARSTHYEDEITVGDYAMEGLRTLVFAKREIPSEELDEWMSIYETARSALHNRDQQVFDAADKIEIELNPIGVTAIEDRLQEDVPETIQWLKNAGIRVWMLTGDKLETAIAIGRTSGMIQANSDILIIGNTTSSSIREKLDNFFAEFGAMTMPVMVITSDAFEIAITEFPDLVMSVANACEAVIMARVSPFWKSHVTDIVRSQGAMTMSIGDGANDVSMLQAAHVGIGVYGREGSQAALASDIAIPRFHSLRRLLMVHGHWTYRRLSVVSVMMLYKNLVFIIAQLWYAFDTLWSPTAYYNDFLMSCFNLVFTVLPPFIFGFWEQDLPQEVLMENPHLYQVKDDSMSIGYLIYYMALGIWQSACAFYGIKLSMPKGALTENGTISYVVVVYIVIFQVMLWGNSQNMWGAIFNAINIVFLPVIIFIYIYFMNWELMIVLRSTLATGTVWMGAILALVAALLPGYIIETFRNRFKPSDVRRYAEEVQAMKDLESTRTASMLDPRRLL